MAKSTTTCNNLLKLLFNATAWANMADNAATSPYTNLYLSLHTADPGVGNVFGSGVATPASSAFSGFLNLVWN